MSDQVPDEVILAEKVKLTPVMPRVEGTFQCLKDGHRQDADGNCPHDGLPLRRLPPSGV